MIGLGAVSAQSGVGRASLADTLASKFHLNKSDVQKVIDQDREEHQAERQQKVSDRLQKLVDEGTITSTQKTSIELKLKQIQTSHEQDKESMKDLSPSERKAKMEAKRAELESWAKAQGIDLAKLQGVFMREHRGEMHEGDRGRRD